MPQHSAQHVSLHISARTANITIVLQLDAVDTEGVTRIRCANAPQDIMEQTVNTIIFIQLTQRHAMMEMGVVLMGFACRRSPALFVHVREIFKDPNAIFVCRTTQVWNVLI